MIYNMAIVLGCAFLLFTTLAINCDCSSVCLSCTDLKESEQCQHIATCHDNEVCFLEKYTTSQGETRYDVGCVDQQMCPVQDLQNTFGKRTSDHSRILCQRCCNNTYICNRDLTCVNPNTSSRQSCYSCSDVDDPSACHTNVTCEANDACYVHYYRTESTREMYDLGCKPATLCLNNNINVFGRRSSEGRHLICGSCCSGSNYCNGNMRCGKQHRFAKECEDLPFNKSGVYTIFPTSDQQPVQALCIMENGKKWTVIQRRYNGSVDFFRTWNEYREGFGSANGEYWLGNSYIHQMSIYGAHELSVLLVDIYGIKKYANYSKFSVADEHSQFLLHLTGYHGDAGDDMSGGIFGGNMNKFTTKDRDNDSYNSNCAQNFHGAWWYGGCRWSGINEIYKSGKLYWQGSSSIVSSIMMIRRT